MSETRSLHRKLAQVMYEAERIPKNGHAPQAMGGYPFVQVGDAADYIRKALGEHVVSMLPTAVEIIGQTEHQTKAGGSMTTVELRVTWTLTDGESNETATIQSYGVGADAGDKYSGKAMTNAMKYALLAGFLLSTGDDVELGDTTDRRPKPAVREPGPGNSGLPTAQQDKSTETERLMGPIERIGAIVAGSGRHTDLEWRQAPDGWSIGWLLEVGDGKAKPQVVVSGPLAMTLFEATSMGTQSLAGMKVTVDGDLYEVHNPPRKMTYRIKAKRLTTSDWIIPADVPPDDPEPVLFDETEYAAIEAALPA